MKKGLCMLYLLMFSLILSGCYKFNGDMTINSDKSGELVFIIAIDNEMLGSLGSSDDDDSSSSSGYNVEDYKQLEENGWEVEEFSEKNDDHDWKGVKLTKKFDNIDDYIADSEDDLNLFGNGSGDADTIDFEYLFTKSGDTYKAKYVFSLESDSDEEMDSSEAQQIESMLDLKFEVNLPNKPESSNATDTSNGGKTLTWDLKYTEPTTIEFEFNIDSNSIMLPVIIGLVSLIVIGVIVLVVVIVKSKKSNNYNK